MLVHGINLPEELLRAQAAGELVVFIGAGVSAPSPSSLPLFDELARQVGEGTGLQRGESESVDRYFGRLKLAGVQVHKAVARVLLNSTSRPHELHTLLTKLFPDGSPVRLVTTNFDKHLSTTLEEQFGSCADTFYAPALPLGDDFAGLVYLHGSATKNPEQCVLTDEDFGRAYLNRAWATRFLESMFQRYSVLFVGYSHSDPVMIYLARGLSPMSRKPRYAFTQGDSKSLNSWKDLGVHELVYLVTPGENAHEAITNCVRDWSVELHRGLLEKAERIRAISETQPPLEGEDADYLKFSLGTIETARIFFRYASHPEWISWLEKNGFLVRFFDSKRQFGEFERELGFWLIDRFFVDHAQDVLAAIQRNGSRIHPEWAWRVWHRLIRRHNDANIDSVFSLWVMLLLLQPYDVLSSDDWSMLLAECRLLENAAAAIQLFTRITTPRLALKEHWSFLRKDTADQPKVDFELDLLHEIDHYLADAFAETIGRQMDVCATPIAPPIFANLVAADNLMRLCDECREGSDPFRVHRQSIEKKDGRVLTTKLDCLTDAARAVITHTVKVSPAEALAQATDLFASKVPILQRLAIFSIARATGRTADEKLAWLLENDLIYRHKTDVFQFLELNYAQASGELRHRIIEVILAGPCGPRFDGVSENTLVFERFNLLVWLHQIAPQCDQVREALESIRRIKPEFREREHPELDFSFGEVRWLEASEGFNVEEITKQDISVFIASRPSPGDETHFDGKRSRYCSSISAAATQTPDWAMSFLKQLVLSGITEDDLWSSAVAGLCNAKLSAEVWATFLQFAASVTAPRAFFDTTMDLLERGSTREKDTLPGELMPAAQRVAERIWSESLQHTKPVPRQMEDWLLEAINRPGGKLARFWLERISSAKRTAGDKWTAIPLEIAERLRTIIRDSSQAAGHARTVIASQLHYLFSIDASFAQVELLPLFDWTRNAIIAEQCWHGFVMWGRWLPGFTEQLLPSFDETIARAGSESDNIRRATIMQIMVLALYRFPDPLSKGWLPNVIRTLKDQELRALAAEIDHALCNLDTSTVDEIWERWLKRYWEERLLGRPKPFTPDEARHTGCWALSVGKHFPEAVKLVAALQPRPRFEHVGFLSRIDSMRLAQNYPAATADLLLVYFSAPDLHLYADNTMQNIWRALVQAELPPEDLRKVEEAMFRLGVDTKDWT
jgi:hypothetical protein